MSTHVTEVKLYTHSSLIVPNKAMIRTSFKPSSSIPVSLTIEYTLSLQALQRLFWIAKYAHHPSLMVTQGGVQQIQDYQHHQKSKPHNLSSH